MVVSFLASVVVVSSTGVAVVVNSSFPACVV